MDARCASWCKLTVVLHILLVAVLASDFILHCLCLLELLLKCNNPAIALLGGAGLELVDLVTDLDGEDVEPFFGDVGSFVLVYCIRCPCRYYNDALSYQ